MDLKKIKEKLKWLDPFTYVDLYIMPSINPKENELLSWVVYLVSAFVFAWLIYTGLGLALATDSPMMIVVSASMEPLYHRGDIVILQGSNETGIAGPEITIDKPSLAGIELESIAKPIYRSGSIDSIKFNSGEILDISQEGSIVVYWSNLMQEPVVHRTVAKLNAGDGWYLLTKGDSEKNTTVDQDCGFVLNGKPSKPCIALYPVPLDDLHGRVLFHVPVVGCVKLWLLDDLSSFISTGALPREFKPGNIC